MDRFVLDRHSPKEYPSLFPICGLIGKLAVPAAVIVSFYTDDAGPLLLDFGDGPVSTIPFTIPPNGIKVLRTRMTSTASWVWGWATVVASYPVQGSVSFRAHV